MFGYPGSQSHVRQALTGFLLAIGIGSAGCGTEPQTPPQPTDVAQEVWSEYRRYHPLHSQEVAISKPLDNGNRVIVLSEPPDRVTPAALRDIHPALGALVAKRHPIGVDGWTEDLVGMLPPMSGDALSELSSDLHMAMFGTSYRARLAPIAPTRKWKGALDVEVRPRELHEWVLGDHAMFWPVDGGPAELGSSLLAPEQTGVYLSKAPGLVLWSFPKKEPFDSQRANVRIFGVESDLVLGAFADEDTVLVVGRERVAPVDVLPPMRFETVKILATAPLRELRQSYERRQLFAGPMTNGKDWAPILLSPPIVDTELGSTLNIADQLLKRWSLNGMVDYERFSYAGEPRQWAFAQPLSTELKAESLTFNWNTAGSGGLVELQGGRSLYWMSRTGALHVSYLPGDQPDPRTTVYEDRAREFFAQQSDPYLVRAVQYTALFQAFRQLGVASVDPVADLEDVIGANEGNSALEAAGTEALKRLWTATDAELEVAGRRATERSFATMGPDVFKASVIRSLLGTGLPEDAALARRVQGASYDQAAAGMERVKAKMAAEMVTSLRTSQTMLAGTKDVAAPKHLAVALVHPALAGLAMKDPAKWESIKAQIHDLGVRQKADEITAAAAFLQEHGLRMEDAARWREAVAATTDVDLIEQRYRDLGRSRPVRSRVRTPSVVWSSGIRILSHGGHNVGSGVPRVTHAVEVEELGQLRLSRQGLSVEPTPELPRERASALGAIAERPAPAVEVTPSGRPPALASEVTGARRLPEEVSSSSDGSGVVIRPREGAQGYKVDVDGSVFHAQSKQDIADTVVRNFERQARLTGKKPLTADIVIRDGRLTADEARGLSQSLHSRFQRRALGASEAYVLDHSEGAASLADFDLSRAAVSEPVSDASGFKLSVSIPRKTGPAKSLMMRILGKGTPPVGAGTASEAAVKSGLRSPADIARELQQRLGKDGDPLLLELAVDAQPDLTEDDVVTTPPMRNAGTTSHTF